MTQAMPHVAARHRAPRSAGGAWARLRRDALAQGRLFIAVVLIVAVGAVVSDSLASGRVGAEADSYTRLAADTGPISTVIDPVGAAAGLAPADQDPMPLSPAAAAAGTVPTRVLIPSIGVDAELVDLTRDASGVLIPPDELLEAGWYRASVVPGDIGPSIIAGHVDDTENAGVFARLRELKPGDLVETKLSDGTSVMFSVDGAVDVAKADFPTNAVYGATPTPQLRLITCNGPYDFGVRHYSNNLVVFASMVDPNLTVGG